MEPNSGEVKTTEPLMQSNHIYPVSEIFTSPQGEGLWAGTLMTFVRLAGCNVGRKPTHRVALPIYTEECTLYDRRTFYCDSDYRTKMTLAAEEILKNVPVGVEHLCITGGEPLLHDLGELIEHATRYQYGHRGLHIHIETSGTRPWPDMEMPADGRVVKWWITVSPKEGAREDMCWLADEIKLLVDENFKLQSVPDFITRHALVWLQPINLEKEIFQQNLKLCLAIQKEKPAWRISTQAHKIWNVR